MTLWLGVTLAVGFLLAGALLLVLPGKAPDVREASPQPEEATLPPEMVSTIAELKLDHDTGKLSDEEFREARESLLKELPLMAAATRAAAAPMKAGGMSLSLGLNIVGVVLLLGTLAAYAKENEQTVRRQTAHAAMEQAMAGMHGEPQGEPAVSPQVQAMVDRLKARLQDAPDDFDGQLLLGRSMLQLGHMAEARDAFMAASKLDPEHPEPFWGLGMVLLASGEVNGAGTALDAALERDPDHAESLFVRAMIHGERQGRPDLALPLLDRLDTITRRRMEETPDDPSLEQWYEQIQAAQARFRTAAEEE